MNQKVNTPTIIVALIVLVAVLYGLFRMETKPATDLSKGLLPPPLPGQDKPAPPPPGMHMPGKLKR